MSKTDQDCHGVSGFELNTTLRAPRRSLGQIGLMSLLGVCSVACVSFPSVDSGPAGDGWSVDANASVPAAGTDSDDTSFDFGAEENDDEASLAEQDRELESSGSEDTVQHISELGGESLLDENVEEEVEATSVDHSEVLESVSSQDAIPVVMNERVQWWINYFTGRGRERFQRHLDRADAYMGVVKPLLVENGVPADLHYLALIESGFVTSARSRAGAQGIWQFMRATGRRYGLTVNSVIDERRDPIRATQAAAEYLLDLRNVFNDWYLAFAAYNCGEGRVLRAIVKGNSRDFWELSEKKLLPKETRHYVPKFLAAMLIAQSREKFNFASNDIEEIPASAGVDVPSSVHLSDVARASGLALDTLEKLNPHLLLKRIPGSARTYTLWVPAEAAPAVAQINDRLYERQKENIRSGIDKQGVDWHKVRKGDSLYQIAKLYGVSVKELKDINGLRSNRLSIGQKIKLLGEASEPASEGSRRSAAGSGGQAVHVVRKGESLYLIARKYGMSIPELKKMNGLSRARIVPGKRLKVTAAAPVAGPTVAANDDDDQAQVMFYRVRSGDSLNKIARKFGASTTELKRLNDLERNVIYAGQLIRVPASL
jgi:membrane-bound lytic murein transglycosylase D